MTCAVEPDSPSVTESCGSSADAVIAALQRRIVELQAQNAALMAQNAVLSARIADLGLERFQENLTLVDSQGLCGFPHEGLVEVFRCDGGVRFGTSV